MYTKQQFRENLYELICLCENEIKISKDKWLIDYLKDYAIPEAYSIIWQINVNKLPAKGDRWFHSAWTIVDNSTHWENSETLESKMLFISNIYRHELED